MQPFDSEFIREQRELAEKATPRPWNVTAEGFFPWYEADKIECHVHDYSRILIQFNSDFPHHHDAMYTVAAANTYPLALAEIERLQAEVERLKAELGKTQIAYNELFTDALHVASERYGAQAELSAIRKREECLYYACVDAKNDLQESERLGFGKLINKLREAIDMADMARPLPAAPRSEK